MKNSHWIIVILTHFGSVCGVGSTPPIQHHLGFSRFRCVRSTFPVCLTDRLAMVVVCSERDVWCAHSGRMCDCNVHEVFHEFKIKLVNQLCIRRERNVSDWKKREKQNNWFNFPTVALFLEAKDVLISTVEWKLWGIGGFVYRYLELNSIIWNALMFLFHKYDLIIICSFYSQFYIAKTLSGIC